jgi:hypothetical protein
MWALIFKFLNLHSMSYSVKQEDSKKQLAPRIGGGNNANDTLALLYKGFATQEKINKRVFNISRASKSFLCFNGRPIHSVAFTIAKHSPILAIECVLNSLLPEFQSLRPELEQLLSEQ